MQLHQLQPTHQTKNKKRISRGGKRGTYSGRGQKGQKSRAGAKMRPANRDLILRIPKKRGWKNKSLKIKPAIITLQKLEKHFEKNSVINHKILKNKKLISSLSQRVKILNTGNLKKSFRLENIKASKSAAEKIKAADAVVTK